MKETTSLSYQSRSRGSSSAGAALARVAMVLALSLGVCLGALSCLPEFGEEVDSIASGFRADRLVSDVRHVRSMALMRDSETGAPKRLYFAESKRGRILVYEFATDQVLAQPFASVPVTDIADCGLQAIALSPTFEEDRYVYVLANVPSPLRTQLIRYRDNGAGLGVNPTIIVDHLPCDYWRNGGGLSFMDDGTLLIGVGDLEDPDRAQKEGNLAGRVLRFNDDGSWPQDNPIAGSHEYARGFRNPTSLSKFADTGGVFVAERRNSADRVAYLQRGKNYGWPEIPLGSSSPEEGVVVATFDDGDVISGLTFHDGSNMPYDMEGNLFVAFEGKREVRRLTLTGTLNTTLVSDDPFIRFSEERPYDLLQLPDGSLLISTNHSIWRVAPIGFSIPIPND